MREFLEDVVGCGGCGLVLNDRLVDCLNVGRIVGGEDSDIGGEFCNGLVWGVVLLVNFDDGGGGSGHANVAKRKEQMETFCDITHLWHQRSRGHM